MAPIKKRTPLRARAATTKPTTHPQNTANPTTTPAISATDLSSFKLNKQDKRHMKHAALMHKVRHASISKDHGKKRRRPAKKMQAAESLGGLKDALPEVEEEEWEGLSEDDGVGDGVALGVAVGKARKRVRRAQREGEGKIQMQSLKHRSGAMKRKQVLERKEQERFARNLAQMVGKEDGNGGGGGKVEVGKGEDGGGGGQAEKWKALRAFIGGTMEKDAAFR